MLQKHSQILEIYQCKEKLVACLIKVVPRDIKYFNGQQIPYKSFRWMQTEQWANFDSFLDELLVTENGFKKAKTFQLENSLSVSIKKSGISKNSLSDLLVHDQIDFENISLVLKCKLKYQTDLEKPEVINGLTKGENVDATQIELHDEYEPQFISKEAENENAKSSPPPYTPNKLSKYEKAMLDVGNNCTDDEEQYIPQSIISDTAVNKEVINHLPKYKPAPLTSNGTDVPFTKSKEVDTEAKSCLRKKAKKTEKFEAKDGEATLQNNKIQIAETNHSATNEKVQRTPVHTRRANKALLVKSDSEKSIEEVENFSHELKAIKCDTKLIKKFKNLSTPTKAHECKRKEETTNKSFRDIEAVTDTEKSVVKRKRVKSDTPDNYLDCREVNKRRDKHSDLFGTDDEEDYESDLSQKLITKKTEKKPEITTTDIVRKRRLPRVKQFQQEKTTINTWLGKKTSNDTKSHQDTPIAKSVRKTKPTEKKSLLSLSPDMNFIMSSLISPSSNLDEDSIHYEELVFNKMSLAEILDTFETHKPELDRIVRASNTKIYTKGTKDVNHMLVTNIIDMDKQLSMVNKMSEVYDKRPGDTATATFYVNNLLPEWIICIMKHKFNLTREEAIAKLKAQDEYSCHLDRQKQQRQSFEGF